MKSLAVAVRVAVCLAPTLILAMQRTGGTGIAQSFPREQPDGYHVVAGHTPTYRGVVIPALHPEEAQKLEQLGPHDPRKPRAVAQRHLIFSLAADRHWVDTYNEHESVGEDLNRPLSVQHQAVLKGRMRTLQGQMTVFNEQSKAHRFEAEKLAAAHKFPLRW